MDGLPSAASLFAGLLFGSVGLFCIQIGRRRQDIRKIVVGIALFACPMFIDGGALLWVVGGVLTLLAFYP